MKPVNKTVEMSIKYRYDGGKTARMTMRRMKFEAPNGLKVRSLLFDESFVEEALDASGEFTIKKGHYLVTVRRNRRRGPYVVNVFECLGDKVASEPRSAKFKVAHSQTYGTLDKALGDEELPEQLRVAVARDFGE